MSLTSRLDLWRKMLNKDRMDHPEEGRAPVTEEEALEQFLYSGVADFIDAEVESIVNDFNVWRPDTDFDLDKAIDDRINAWVDAYAEETHASPSGEDG